MGPLSKIGDHDLNFAFNCSKLLGTLYLCNDDPAVAMPLVAVSKLKMGPELKFKDASNKNCSHFQHRAAS